MSTMVREIAITLYLSMVKMIFILCRILPQKNKTVFMVSFGDNTRYVYEQLKKRTPEQEAVFLCKGRAFDVFRADYGSETVVPFESRSPKALFQSVYHLATARHVIVDNYYGILAAAILKPGTEVIQLWHAAGAIKKFGLHDESIKNRSRRANQRFLGVYKKFDRVVVGSDAMVRIFTEAFGLPQENFLRTGIPRTDFFFDESLKDGIIADFKAEYKDIQGKKTILYAPTYRDNELDEFKLMLDIELMKRELGQEYVLLLKLHPAVQKTVDYEREYPGFVYDFTSSGKHINELLLVTDILISDYSSIPYEYSLLQKPMLFFAYDLEEYTRDRGLWEEYETMVPGPVVSDTRELAEVIKRAQFDLEAVRSFSRKWNKYSTGKSSSKLIDYLEKGAAAERQRGVM
ncbi:CDP-glycerol glycerophosphotransferase family protein [Peribacillus sp. SCS-37]|uniref:CDP-glycerol glycerophosphotransferase family protein n=1 Tax=Paraperibacillus esterisolvens TaxID=3115296 RepID=UPI003906605E